LKEENISSTYSRSKPKERKDLFGPGAGGVISWIRMPQDCQERARQSIRIHVLGEETPSSSTASKEKEKEKGRMAVDGGLDL